jgi:hypothetical protein
VRRDCSRPTTEGRESGRFLESGRPGSFRSLILGHVVNWRLDDHSERNAVAVTPLSASCPRWRGLRLAGAPQVAHTGRDNFDVWLDREGALQGPRRLGAERATRRSRTGDLLITKWAGTRHRPTSMYHLCDAILAARHRILASSACARLKPRDASAPQVTGRFASKLQAESRGDAVRHPASRRPRHADWRERLGKRSSRGRARPGESPHPAPHKPLRVRHARPGPRPHPIARHRRSYRPPPTGALGQHLKCHRCTQARHPTHGG